MDNLGSPDRPGRPDGGDLAQVLDAPGRLAVCAGQGVPQEPQPSAEATICTACGGKWLIRRKKFVIIRGFPEILRENEGPASRRAWHNNRFLSQEFLP